MSGPVPGTRARTPLLKTIGSVLAVLVLALLVYLSWSGADRPDPVVAPPATSSTSAAAPGSERDRTGLPLVDLRSLPVEVAQTVALIDRGGPFPYARDGSVFGNRERLLPTRPAGYYREYTVPTPGSPDRGARRLVTGDSDRQLFYTGDHYASFVQVRR